MWLFCKHGFFSAVRHNAKPDTILLRARIGGDLDIWSILCALHPPDRAVTEGRKSGRLFTPLRQSAMSGIR